MKGCLTSILCPLPGPSIVFENREGLKGEAQIVLFGAPLKASMAGLTEMSL